MNKKIVIIGGILVALILGLFLIPVRCKEVSKIPDFANLPSWFDPVPTGSRVCYVFGVTIYSKDNVFLPSVLDRSYKMSLIQFFFVSRENY